MIAAANVDFPVPFGPIMAWISPVFRTKSTPFKISLSSIETCKFLMSKRAIIPSPFSNVCLLSFILAQLRSLRNAEQGANLLTFSV